MNANPTDPLEHSRMTLAEHLDELRRRLTKGFLAIGVVFLVGMGFQSQIVDFVKRPYREAAAMLNEYWLEKARKAVAEDPSLAPQYFADGWPELEIPLRQVPELVGLKVGEGFFFGLKVVLYASLVVGGPVLLWQLWQFVAAGLYERERHLVYAYFPISVLMMLAGVAFGFFGMVPYAIYFLNQNEFALMQTTTDYYLTFLTGLCLALGVVFQLPLILTFLGRTGVVQAKTLSRYRGHFMIGAFIFAAILTPPDPVTQAMLGVPLVILYEVGILGVRIWGKPREDDSSRSLEAKPS